ncbi:uncharacterized protein LOC131681242 [Topomyia yanbarensis]|uniref:uncharacterized protein LOC131681242 n=1 Tax=Topomyia yanbarensis TaxID=2498891 RepID=UPI00273C88AB|nr:uncharacterized protein LOC131681242 [Topomyia yanbarensis]
MSTFSKKIVCYITFLVVCNFGVRFAEVIEVMDNNRTYQQNFDGLPDDGGGPGTRILSRKRRFVSFPEGSSFQVVYDQTIPVIGSTLLFTVGVTVAAAWQLPSVSNFEILRLLQEKISGGSLLRRTDENVNDTTLYDTSTSGYDKASYDAYYYSSRRNQSYYPSTSGKQNIFSYYYDSPTRQQSNNGRIKYYTSEKEYAGDVNDKYRTKWKQPSSSSGYANFPPNYVTAPNGSQKNWGNLVTSYLQDWVRRHPPNYPMHRKRFYPVFGKRSIDEHTHPEDKFFLDHHRSTRHKLYRKIETFLDAKGKHGHHCVLRALCECGQKRDGVQPESFLREILKAVFSLPTTHEDPVDYTHRTYDEAHAHTGDCAKRYPFCKDSIWSEDFIF